ncbi:MAG: efflux RND transporter periplasmic adaptor subunit [Chromatiales bacterium]
MIRPAALLALIAFAVGAPAHAVPVTVGALGDLITHPVRSAPAHVESLNDSLISAEITARIERIPVRVGDRVAQGDLLVVLDCRDYQSQQAAQEAGLQKLQAQRRLARSQLARARDLSTARNISDEQLEQRETELSALGADIRAQEEALRQAKLRAERCEVRAPFDAVVRERVAQVGALASPGTPLVRVVEQGDLEVSADLALAEAREVAASPSLVFVHGAQRLPVRLRRLVPVFERRTQTREARLEFTAGQAPAGASGRLSWEASEALLPADLLVRRGDRLGVFIARDGRARFHALPNALEGRPARVDLPAGTLIVLEGRQALGDGDALDLRPAEVR